MLLQTSSVEKCCPRFWSLAVAAGLLSGAVLLSGLGLKAAAAPEPLTQQDQKQEEPKKEQPKKEEQPLLPGIPNIKDTLPPNVPPEVTEMLEQQMKQLQDQLQRLQQQGGLPGNPGMPGIGGIRIGEFGIGNRLDTVASRIDLRMGAAVKKPDAVLAEQLDLPKDRGLVVGDVKPNTPAAKAGLKTNDILMELDGKPVSRDAKEFAKILDDIKPNTPVDAVVLRKGTKETVKGLTLPEAPKPQDRFNLTPAGGILPGFGNGQGNAAAGGRSINVQRSNDSFVGTFTEAGMSIIVKGKLVERKAQVEEISITDEGKTRKYTSVDQVPEDLREDVKSLIRSCETGRASIRSNN